MLPKFLLAAVGAALSVAAAAVGGCGGVDLVSCKVEVPACLRSCISAYRLCTVCTTNLANVESCIANVCPHVGQTAFASTYFRSLCATDAYMAGRTLVSVSGSCDPVIEAAGLVDQERKIMRAERRARKKSQEVIRRD